MTLNWQLRLASLLFLLHSVRGDTNVTVNFAEEFKLQFKPEKNGSDDQYCQWFPKGIAETLKPTSSPQNVPERPKNWTYEVNSQPENCEIRVLHAVSEDHGMWKGQSSQNWLPQFSVFVQEAPESVQMVTSVGTFTVKNPGVFNAPVTCSAKRSRPEPEVKWFIGEQELAYNWTRVKTNLNDDYVDVEDTLKYFPLASHDEKQLRCVYEHEAALPDSIQSKMYEGTLNITVETLPDPENVVIETPNLIIGQSATVQIQFHSRPEANSMEWDLFDLDENVIMNKTQNVTRDAGDVQKGRFTFGPIVVVGGSHHTTKLTISELLESDLGVINKFFVTNNVGTTNYTFTLDNAEAVGLSSGAVAGIVIGVLIVIALIGLVIFVIIKKKKDKKKKKSKNLRKIAAREQAGQGQRSETGIANDGIQIEERSD